MAALGLQPGEAKVLAFAPAAGHDIKLLEVDEDLLEIFQQGAAAFKGYSASDAALCTENATYKLQQVEATNVSLLALAPELGKERTLADQRPLRETAQNIQQGVSVATEPLESAEGSCAVPIELLAKSSCRIEVLKATPTFEGLDHLLKGSTYAGPETPEVGSSMGINAEPSAHLYTFNELLLRCQSSEAELWEELMVRNALDMDGKWRLLDPEYLRDVQQLLLLTAEEHNWSLASIPADEAVDALRADNIDSRVVLHGLRMLAIDSYSRKRILNTVCIDEKKVCLLVAEVLLAAKSQWPLVEFMAAWKAKLPQTVHKAASAELLKGEVLMDSDGFGATITHFSARTLSKIPAKRFTQLFAARQWWQAEDILPFLTGLQASC